DGVVDVYLSDFKYGNDECALRLSSLPNYFRIISRNHMLAGKQADLLIRHLVMPNHIECDSKPILDWITENLDNNVRVNIMSQYRPEYKALEYSDINRRLNREEYFSVLEHARKIGLWNIETQKI
ncbi:MAG: radical SAM protein, partial [Candidatus Micrarchaeia archaeon]